MIELFHLFCLELGNFLIYIIMNLPITTNNKFVLKKNLS